MQSNCADKSRFAVEELLTALDVLHRELASARLPDVAADVASYAWDGCAFERDGELLDALHTLSSADELCGATLMSPNGDELFSQQSKNTLRQLVNAAHARRDLDEGESVRVEGLAALARVAEKTIRMAANPSRPGAIRVRKEGHWAFIDAPEALAWLARRGDFQPTRKRGEVLDQSVISSAHDLAAMCRRWRIHKSLEFKALAEALGWNGPQRKAYEQIEEGNLTDQMTRFSPQALHAFGKFLRMPQPEGFAREAFRVLAANYAEHLADSQLLEPKH